MNRAGTFARWLLISKHLLDGKALTSRDVRKLTGVSVAQAKRYMLEVERVLPVRAIEPADPHPTTKRILTLEKLA